MTERCRDTTDLTARAFVWILSFADTPLRYGFCNRRITPACFTEGDWVRNMRSRLLFEVGNVSYHLEDEIWHISNLVVCCHCCGKNLDNALSSLHNIVVLLSKLCKKKTNVRWTVPPRSETRSVATDDGASTIGVRHNKRINFICSFVY